jgi:hypothetical protein
MARWAGPVVDAWVMDLAEGQRDETIECAPPAPMTIGKLARLSWLADEP